MYIVLLLIGVLVSAAGFIAIGFGIPINAFSLGNTLIVTGATAVVGGFVVIALATVVRHLGRIADLLKNKPLAAQSHRPVDVADAPGVPPTARVAPPVPSPVPTRPSVSRPPEATAPRPEPRLEPRAPVPPRFPPAPATSATSDAPGPLDWMRPKPRPSAGPVEPPVLEIPDEAPLSPRPPQRPLFSPPPLSPAASVQPAEPKAWSPGRSGDVTEARPQTAPVLRAEQVSRTETVARVAPAEDRAEDVKATKEESRETGLFDVAWPDVRADASASSEPANREPKLEAAPPRPREEPAAEKRAEESGKENPASARPMSILKSGVIDGMGYTLYADGSIEAEMPQGTVTFASVDALRAHLEQSA